MGGLETQCWPKKKKITTLKGPFNGNGGYPKKSVLSPGRFFFLELQVYFGIWHDSLFLYIIKKTYWMVTIFAFETLANIYTDITFSVFPMPG